MKNLSQRCVAQSRTDRFVLLATIAVTKVLGGMSEAGYVTLGNFSCTLCRKKIAREVAGKIAYLILVSKHNCSSPMIVPLAIHFTYQNFVIGS